MEESTKWGLVCIGMFLFIVISLAAVNSRDKRVIKEHTGQDCTRIIFSGDGSTRVYETKSGERWIVTGIFWTNAFKQQ